MIIPVEPNIRETDITRKGEQAANIVLKYLEGVSMIYDVDERWLVQIVADRLNTKLRD